MKRAVITGLGAVTPLGNNVSDYWRNLIEGKSGAAPVTKFDVTHYKTKFACEVKDFDPLVALDKGEVRKLDLFTQYALVATAECLNDSGIDLQQCNLNRAGVIIATGVGGIQTFEEEIATFIENNKLPRFSPFFIPKMIIPISGMSREDYSSPVSTCCFCSRL